jgi:hypothetical protein
MNNDKAYVLGFTISSLGCFLGSKWSPDYMEMCSNGNNWLFIFGFGICVLIMLSIVDYYYKRKKKNKNVLEEKKEK